MSDDRFSRLKDYSLKLLSIRPRSTKELQGKLTAYSIKHGLGNQLVLEVIVYLQESDLLDDERFTAWWIEQRLGYKPKGLRIIKMELVEKGISKEMIETFLQKSNVLKNKEFDAALLFVQKKFAHMQNYSTIEQKRKMEGLLLRRGFQWNLIHTVIDYVFKKE